MTEPMPAYVPDPADAAEDRQFDDYWGFSENHKFFLPDGRQYIAFKVMTEGDRQKYQKLTNRDLTVSRQSGDAKMKVDQASDRNALFQVACIDWNLRRGGESVTFTNDGRGGTLQQWLQVADPRIIDDLEKAIRMANPWMLGDMKSEDIQKQIDDLQDMLKIAQEREAGNAS